MATPPYRLMAGRSPPAGLLAEANAECSLAHDLMGQDRIGGMEAAAAGVAEQPLELARLEHAGAAAQLHRHVDDLEARLHRVLLGRDDLGRPAFAMVDTGRPF